ncbi:hypothetical protein GE061_009700 [Apolygus lucorum]|uniref:Uncharacterized protein n=1 Tax=Apolygus lucorum TaxID=248454 RepID=A0A8S9Y532_APOLU|nr:hypothetical protein GE061_009700 [Apolygus lucorum]
MANSSSGATLQNFKPFEGSGFAEWEFRLRIHLERKGCLNALENEEVGTRSTSTSEQKEWDRMDALARDTIVQWLADSVLGTVRSCKTAKEMFDSLKTTYAKQGLSARVDLRRELMAMKFVHGKLTDFLEKYERIVNQLRECGDKMEDSEVIAQLLTAMPESYQAVTVSIDILYAKQPEEVTLQFVRRKLLQEEDKSERKDIGRREEPPELVCYRVSTAVYEVNDLRFSQL